LTSFYKMSLADLQSTRIKKIWFNKSYWNLEMHKTIAKTSFLTVEYFNCAVPMLWCVCNDMFLGMDSLFEDTTITYVRCINFNNLECLRNWEIQTFYRLDFKFDIFDNLSMYVRPRRWIFLQPIMQWFDNIV